MTEHAVIERLQYDSDSRSLKMGGLEVALLIPDGKGGYYVNTVSHDPHVNAFGPNINVRAYEAKNIDKAKEQVGAGLYRLFLAYGVAK